MGQLKGLEVFNLERTETWSAGAVRATLMAVIKPVMGPRAEVGQWADSDFVESPCPVQG